MASPPGTEDGPADPLAGHPDRLRPLTGALVAAVLAGRGYAVTTDPAGDLVGRWADSLIWFLRPGAAGELLQVRTLTAPAFPIEYVPALHAFCNAWNHDHLWPKAFVHVEDDGQARVCGEVITDLECGVTPHQLDRLLHCGISTGCQLAAEVDRLPGGVAT
ncbi:YbjN domain-containing protein [Micromonospora endolithica]|uniref:YbjN domain-containing protein n=1 Tax=Micromonospora endolithica TaxID=230091 RepID=A0A3A9ZLZ1_9ACTN|nr:YbjN domain-containing protein [Micromonospora endolithica]RKN49239.1 YbjN domain-containing protein [Micromonospora endolithica]TWJ23413.1 putative sensory transduction regulator [Micromonospora endolithica]